MSKKLLIASLILSVNLVISGQNKVSTMQAMYIYNFLSHIQWPAGSLGNQFIIGVYGNSDTYNDLVYYTNGRKVGTKSIKVVKITNIQDISSCQVLFVPGSQFKNIQQINDLLANKPCLIISEKEGSTSLGSTMEFINQGSKLGFRINTAVAKKQNLLISNRLIEMGV